MPYSASLSTNRQTSKALDEICTHVQNQLAGSADLAIVFFSPHHASEATNLAATVRQRLGCRCLLGCQGEAIVGNDHEIENGPALSIWAAHWTQKVELVPFHLTLEATPDGHSLMGWPDALGGVNPEQALLLLLADPYTFPVDHFLKEMNRAYHGLRVVGGMASGGQGGPQWGMPGQAPLLLGEQALDRGAVGVLLSGPVKVRSVVSQGCRPIGRHLVVTRARDNVIYELGGVPVLEQLQQLWQELPERDRALVQGGLHVGLVINEYQGEFQRGDFLVRNVMGLDRDSGALAITDRVRVGQTVQFHVRDAQTADEDLHALLQIDLSAHERPPAGALLFTCNGRGTRLFPQPHHDARAVRAEAGDLPLAGFFAQGELGPVGGQNFIHGFTASVVLFE